MDPDAPLIDEPVTGKLLQFEANPGKLQFVPKRADFESVNPKEGGQATKRVVVSSAAEVVVSHVEVKDVRENGLADGESFMLRLPSGLGVGGEAGMLELPEELVVGPLGVNLTLEFTPEHEGQYSIVLGFWAG